MVQIISVEEGSAQGCNPPSPQACPCSFQEYCLSCDANVKVEAGKEAVQNFFLEFSPFKICGTISGIVKNKHGHLLHNALIKVFDSNHNPITHVFTNQEGQFLICLPPGNYILKAVK